MAGCKGKSEWPELAGTYGEAAAAIIKSEKPEVNVHIIEEGMVVTTDFRCDRVCVFVDKVGTVKMVPKIG